MAVIVLFIILQKYTPNLIIMKTNVLAAMAVSIFGASAGNLSDSNQISELFEVQTYEFPQEKVYVHTDRNTYLGGDTIWLRGYVVDAVSHQPVAVSKYLYVEMRSPSDSLLSRVKIRNDRGVYAGYIALPQTAAEADYTLSAYTMFMESTGEDYFFKRPIRVVSAFSTINTIGVEFSHDKSSGRISASCTLTDNKSGKPAEYKSFKSVSPDGREQTLEKRDRTTVDISRARTGRGFLYVAYDKHAKYIPVPDYSDDYDVTFHPEGGHLAEGVPCRVAFKAVASDGRGERVSGRVIDSKGTEVASFEDLNAGMGFFELTPRQGERYRAICRNEAGEEKEFQLPEATEGATVLRVERQDSVVVIKAVGAMTAECRLIVHERGRLLYSGYLHPDSRQVAFMQRDIPDGVVNAVLFDRLWNPLSERLFFIGNGRNNPEMTAGKPTYGNREKVTVSVRFPENVQPGGNYSVAVTDNKIVDSGSSAIASTLLLSSELKGSIERPEYYFSGSPEAAEALDALMLTQGWRRYDIPALVRGKISFPQGMIERGQAIGGTIKSKWRNKPEKGALINVLVPKYRYAGVFESDSLGRFLCQGFDFPENTTYLLQAWNDKGDRIYPNFQLDEERFPAITLLPPLAGKSVSDRNSVVDNGTERAKYNGMEVMLEEIIVTGMRLREPEDVYEAMAFRSYDWKEMEKEKVTSVEELLRKIPGLIQTGRDYRFRGNPVSLFIDNMPQNVLSSGENVNEGFVPMKTPFSGIRGYTSHLTADKTTHNTLPAFGGPTESTLDLIERIPFDLIRRVDFIRPSEAVMLGQKGTSGGALMLTTKRGDEVTAKEFPDYVSVTPLGYQRKAEFYSPKYTTPEAVASTIPDLRPTLYWNPCIAVGSDGRSTFSFYSSDVEDTSYTVRLEGVTDAGEIVAGDCTVVR